MWIDEPAMASIIDLFGLDPDGGVDRLSMYVEWHRGYGIDITWDMAAIMTTALHCVSINQVDASCSMPSPAQETPGAVGLVCQCRRGVRAGASGHAGPGTGHGAMWHQRKRAEGGPGTRSGAPVGGKCRIRQSCTRPGTAGRKKSTSRDRKNQRAYDKYASWLAASNNS